MNKDHSMTIFCIVLSDLMNFGDTLFFPSALLHCQIQKFFDKACSFHDLKKGSICKLQVFAKFTLCC